MSIAPSMRCHPTRVHKLISSRSRVRELIGNDPDIAKFDHFHSTLHVVSPFLKGTTSTPPSLIDSGMVALPFLTRIFLVAFSTP